MSAPDTNVERQIHQHRPALTGIGTAVTFAIVLFLAWIGYVAYNAREDPIVERESPAAAVPIQGEVDAGPVIEQ